MNKLYLIGNLTKAPESRVTQGGATVCSFTVAVNNRHKKGKEDEATFFRVSAWNALGENCAKYLDKGKKVAVVGPVSLNQYKRQDGQMGASLEVLAQDVEFLSSRNEGGSSAQTFGDVAQTSYTDVSDTITDDELPF